MTLHDMMTSVLALFPDAVFDEISGEVVLFTGLTAPYDWAQDEITLQPIDDCL